MTASLFNNTKCYTSIKLRVGSVQVYKTKRFARFAGRARIGEAALRVAISRAAEGLIDADLGGSVIK